LGGRCVAGLETTEDETHPWFFALVRGRGKNRLQSLLANPFFQHILKTGGSFKSTKFSINWSQSGKRVSLGSPGGNNTTYDGWVLPVDPIIAEGAVPDYSTDTSLMNIGALAILHNKPDYVLADMGQTLAELKREGLPSANLLSTFRDRSPRSVGKDHLNYQFGWKPIIQSVYDLANSISTADKQWAVYLSNAEKLLRREYQFPVDRSIEITDVALGGSVYPILPGGLCSGQNSQLVRTRELTTTRRFSAAYMYFVPGRSRVENPAIRKVLQYQAQYGLEIDPQLLWELSPWSWLIDWFLPIGDFVDSVSSLTLGNMALPWAFISEHTIVRDTYTRPGATLLGGGGVGKLEVVYDYKRRIPASPLGFGLSWADLSPKQLSLLAAIGITR